MMQRFIFLAAVLTLGCTPSTSPTAATTTTYVGCNGDKRINLTQIPVDIASEDGTLTLHLLAAAPAMPLAGENTWTMAIQTPDGNPANVKSVSGVASMPDHGHTSSVTPQAVQQPNGQWLVSSVSLTMAGVWRVTFTIERSDGTKATALVYACVAG